MNFSLPSKRRAVRFSVVFYAATALLFFGFFSVFGIFGLQFSTYVGLLWPTVLHPDQFHTAFVVVGLAVATIEPRVTGVDS